MTVLILAKEETEKAANLRKVFGGFSCFTIYDKMDETFHPRTLGGMQRKNAWDYAIDFLEERNIKGPVCLIEDDVAGPQGMFEFLLNKFVEEGHDLGVGNIGQQQDYPDWNMWRQAKGFFNERKAWRSFCPVTLMSEEMVNKLLDFGKRMQGYCYLELLFISVAKKHELKIIDILQDEDYGMLFPWFYFTPAPPKPLRGICHPVKFDDLHRQICFGK